MEDRLHALFAELRLVRLPSPRRSQYSRSSDHKENPTKKERQAMDPSCPFARVDFPRWEDGDLIGWISRAERYFQYHRTPEASMVNIATIHLGREAAQWYDWYMHTPRSLNMETIQERTATPLRTVRRLNHDAWRTKITTRLAAPEPSAPLAASRSS
ncbi:hypothetical protein BHM03_00044152 [Ensete ventricosum]|nr:hypothetical protein BHM03_00044152 [Ensete ventricosum]